MPRPRVESPGFPDAGLTEETRAHEALWPMDVVRPENGSAFTDQVAVRSVQETGL